MIRNYFSWIILSKKIAERKTPTKIWLQFFAVMVFCIMFWFFFKKLAKGIKGYEKATCNMFLYIYEKAPNH